MKKLLYIIIFIGTTFSLYGAELDNIINLFYTGNALYEQGKYTEAVKKYEEIITEGYASGPLYYNLGNCYFKLGLLGKTILYYERAKRLIPRDPELIFNLKYVYSLLEDKIEPPRRNWLVRKADSIIHFFTLGRWIGVVTVVWLIFTITAIVAIFSAGFRRVFKYIGIASAIFIIFGLINILFLYIESISAGAIILSKEVSVRYGPGEGEVEAFVLHEGTQVSVKAEQDGWFQIQLPDGKSGWLPEGAIEKI